MAENEVYKWTPRAPIRLYYSEGDEMVSPQEAKVACNEISRRGGDIKMICVGNQQHLSGILVSIPYIRRWFDELTEKRNLPPF